MTALPNSSAFVAEFLRYLPPDADGLTILSGRAAVDHHRASLSSSMPTPTAPPVDIDALLAVRIPRPSAVPSLASDFQSQRTPPALLRRMLGEHYQPVPNPAPSMADRMATVPARIAAESDAAPSTVRKPGFRP